ncbi:MAG: hypothetical protein Q7J64_04685 [Elusimicrobiota bacterium]|nr:hypothetical protein [Elusimicrobiota bacterium]
MESFLDSTGSSEPSAFLKTAVRAAVEGAVVAGIGVFVAGRVWSSAAERKSLLIGGAAAWAASSVSVAWLLWGRERSMKAFWLAFGGGMALRAGILLALAVWGYGRKTVSIEGLLLSYVFALLALLLTLEMRHLRIR